MIKYTGNNKIEPIQPPCKKTIYYSQEEANDMIRHINETRITRNIRSYQCPVCGLWHLTSRQGK